jgi:hypothetical protein
MLTDLQKKIYNTFLKNSRYNQPFQYRKDFTDISENISYILKKLELFFQKYNHIKIEEYFEAPRFLHPNEKYPFLDYFTTRPAIRAYSIFQKQKEDENPEKQFENIKESLRFIGMFCFKNKINLKDYLKHKFGYMFSWLNHYREHKINPYSLMELGDISCVYSQLNEEERDLFSNTMIEKFETFKVRYHASPKTKAYVKEVTNKVENFLKKELHNK